MINLISIIVYIASASLSALFGIIILNKVKGFSSIFFVLTALFLYINMIFKVLNRLNIFILEEIKIFGFDIFTYLLDILPLLSLTIAFLIVIFTSKKE